MLGNLTMYLISTIDLVISNTNYTVTRSLNLSFEKEYPLHHPALNIVIKLQCTIKVKVVQNLQFAYNFKKANYIKLYHLIENFDWSTLQYFSDINLACESFYNTLYYFFDECDPLKLNYNTLYPPWFNTSIIKKLKAKNKYRKLHARFPHNQAYLTKFQSLRSDVKSMIKKILC